MVSTELPRKPFKDPLVRKQEAFAARKAPKKNFGERATKKTNIPYDESKKCRTLMEFGVEIGKETKSERE